MRASAKRTEPAGPIWPADAIERRPTASLIPYARNARTHSPEQIAQIAASIREWGWTMPILVDEEGMVIAGHGRLLAAQRLNLDDVPVMVARGWSDAKVRAYVLADNKLAENAGWDEQLLRIELDDLASLGFDLPLIGFSDAEIVGLTRSNPGLTDPDAAPEPPAEPITRPGDLWQLGRHRLICGDCTKPEDVARVLDGAVPHLMVTDPPYGVEYDAKWRNRQLRVDFDAVRATGIVANDARSDWREAWALFPGDVVYAWSPPGDLLVAHHDSLVAAGFEIRMQIIWAKQHFIIGRGNYHVQHDPCWYAVRKGATAHWQGDRSQSTVWNIKAQIGWESARPDNADKATGHSTQKPVECMRRPIENNSAAGDAIYEPFSGSGTTIIAAEMTGRTCYAIEIDPAYCDVAIERWQKFTGEKACRL